MHAETPRVRVLIVDDHVDSAESLAELMQLCGYETRLAHDGWQAVHQARAWQPQALLLDINLPGLDGQEVARRIRRTEWGASALLIALSGWGAVDDREQSLAAGFNHHLVKPVDLHALEALLATAFAPHDPPAAAAA